MNINSAFSSRYLKAADISEPIVATIARIEFESINEGEDPKPVLYFEDSQQGLVLNRTNATTLCMVMKSEETDDWVGKQIGFRKEMVHFQSQLVGAIRCFDPAPPKMGGFGKKPGGPKPAPAAPAAKEDDVPDSWEEPIPNPADDPPVRAASRRR